MSVWPVSISTSPLLIGSEGALDSVSIAVEPRHLESLLEALAQLDFPLNPQIYHDAAVIYRYADGHEVTEPVTLVEFPAYEGQLDRIRASLLAYGFDAGRISVTGILDDIHSGERPEPAPDGAVWQTRVRHRHSGLPRTAPLQ